MTPEEREMLKKTLELAQENNDMLRSVKRGMFWGRVIKIAYWLIIIGAAVGVYYYITPYIDSAVGAYGNVKVDLKSFVDLFKLNK
ncbi:MAG: hypothetical protein WC657_02680 [Candidatus Paceibacterota bacterium]|jgi:uncharacterized membrane protein